MYDGAAVARRVRVDFERCDPAVRLEESARVRGSRASRTCHYNMFARGGSLSTAQPTVAVLRAHVDDLDAVFAWGAADRYKEGVCQASSRLGARSGRQTRNEA